MYTNFGKFISQKRVEKKITLRKMAEMLNVSAPFLTDVEKDRRNPFDMDKLVRLAQILELNEEDNALMLNLAGKRGMQLLQICLNISLREIMLVQH